MISLSWIYFPTRRFNVFNYDLPGNCFDNYFRKRSHRDEWLHEICLALRSKEILVSQRKSLKRNSRAQFFAGVVISLIATYCFGTAYARRSYFYPSCLVGAGGYGADGSGGQRSVVLP